jgi:hypothetical protein
MARTRQNDASGEGEGRSTPHYPYDGPNPHTFAPHPHPTLTYQPPRPDIMEFRDDPFLFASAYWPDVRFYRKQRLVIESVRDNDETYCYAAHQMGKDFLAGFVVLWKFLCFEPCRVITTSVKDDHLRVLWGEIGRFVANSRVPLNSKAGGQLVVKHRELRKLVAPPTAPGATHGRGGNSKQALVADPFQYALGMVSEKGEGMAGHHARFTLLVVDEASGVDYVVVERASSWAKKMIVIGNPYGGPDSWFSKHCKGGDVLAP